MSRRGRRAWIWFYRSLFLRDRPLTVKLLVYSAMLVVIPLLVCRRTASFIREHVELDLMNESTVSVLQQIAFLFLL
ncbi:MAG: hypothetical protein K0Q73_2365 [Paenibacillus sp.]|jgi:two-component system sensor histidine kinase YesM|nr:hypothetical protein [Paenibacillus sp.]